MGNIRKWLCILLLQNAFSIGTNIQEVGSTSSGNIVGIDIGTPDNLLSTPKYLVDSSGNGNHDYSVAGDANFTTSPTTTTTSISTATNSGTTTTSTTSTSSTTTSSTTTSSTTTSSTTTSSTTTSSTTTTQAPTSSQQLVVRLHQVRLQVPLPQPLLHLRPRVAQLLVQQRKRPQALQLLHSLLQALQPLTRMLQLLL